MPTSLSLENHDSNRLRLLYSLGDFEQALSAAEFLGECNEDKKYSRIELRRFRCFETTMIVSYLRPFSTSKGRIPSFNFDMIEMVLNTEQQELHDEIRKLRNKVFAHSDKEMMAMEASTFPIGDEKDSPQFPYVRFDEGVRFLGPRRLEVIALFREIISRIAKSMYREAQKAPDEFNMSVRPTTL